jgi:hypothetical protein
MRNTPGSIDCNAKPVRSGTQQGCELKAEAARAETKADPPKFTASWRVPALLGNVAACGLPMGVTPGAAW